MKKGFRYLILFVFILSLTALYSCSNKNDRSESGDEKTKSDSISDLTFTLEKQEAFLEDYTTFMNSRIEELDKETESQGENQGISESVTNYDKIVKSYEEGDLDEETYSTYTILSAYNPSSLPTEYQGDYHYGLSIQGEIRYIFNHWGELSADTKTILEPYLVPLNDSRSIYQVGTDTKTSSGFSFGTKVYASGPEYELIEGYEYEYVFDDAIFTIIYPHETDGALPFYEARLEDVKGAIQDAYVIYKNFFGTSLSHEVIVELFNNGTDEGEEWTDSESMDQTYYRIRLNTKLLLDTRKTKTTFVHELFHCFQEEIGMGYDGNVQKWAAEATATWSEHFIYSGYNTEQGYLPRFFRTLHKNRITSGNNFEYASYMLFYYLSDYGDTKIGVREFLFAAVGGNHAIRGFFDSYYSNFPTMYAEFAKYNLNTETLKYYNDYGYLKGEPKGQAKVTVELGGKDSDNQDVKLNGGSLKYYFYSFKDVDDAKHIQFTFQPMTDTSTKRQAAIFAEGQWRVEDWTELTEVKYCRNSDDPLQHVDRVILIYSNSDMKDLTEVEVDTFTVETDDCPDHVKIVMKGNYIISGYGNEWKAEFTMTDYCKVDDHDLFFTYDCAYNMTGDYKSQGVTYLDTYGGFHETIIGDIDIYTGFPRILYPGALGDDKVYEELVKMGIDENIPETGILITLPYFETQPVGLTNFYLPPPLGHQTDSTPFMVDGISIIGAIVLPQDIRDGKPLTFDLEIDVQNYDTPLNDMFKTNFSSFSTYLEGLGVPGMEMPDLSDYDLEGLDLESLGLPEGFEMPNMPASEDPMSEVLQGLSAIIGGGTSGYTTTLTVTVEITWPDE